MTLPENVVPMEASSTTVSLKRGSGFVLLYLVGLSGTSHNTGSSTLFTPISILAPVAGSDPARICILYSVLSGLPGSRVIVNIPVFVTVPPAAGPKFGVANDTITFDVSHPGVMHDFIADKGNIVPDSISAAPKFVPARSSVIESPGASSIGTVDPTTLRSKGSAAAFPAIETITARNAVIIIILLFIFSHRSPALIH